MGKLTGRPTGRPRVDHSKLCCTRCGAPRDHAHARCRKCLAAYKLELRQRDPSKHREALRKWRDRNIERARELARQSYQRNRAARIRNAVVWQQNNPKKSRSGFKENCRSALKYAIDTGRVIRPSHCNSCGVGGKIHAHHNDYTQPLAVEWLCTACHGFRHRKGVA